MVPKNQFLGAEFEAFLGIIFWTFWPHPRAKYDFLTPPKRLQKGPLGEAASLDRDLHVNLRIKPVFRGPKIRFYAQIHVQIAVQAGGLSKRALLTPFEGGSKNRISREDGAKKSKR